MLRRRSLELLVTCVLALGLAGGSWAVCTTDPCVGGGNANFDCDRDGLSDLEECGGLVVAGTTYPRCGAGECLDPRTSDLFVKFEKAAPSAYTELGISDAGAFGLITQPTGGLAMRVHVLPAATVLPPIGTNTQNAITARMSALLVREVRGPSTSCPITSALGLINGVTSVGAAGVAQIFTQRIIDHVNCVYQAGGVANPNTSAAATADKVKMVLHTTAHETIHGHRGAPESVERFGGHHYKAGTGCVMDQASTYSTRRGVVFATPQVFCGPDQAAVLAGETALGAIQCEDPNDVLDEDNFTTACLSATP